jgi:hypothetical protein
MFVEKVVFSPSHALGTLVKFFCKKLSGCSCVALPLDLLFLFHLSSCLLLTGIVLFLLLWLNTIV